MDDGTVKGVTNPESINRTIVKEASKKLHGAAGDNARRLQRLQEILDELVALTDWKKL
jgi:hypothetical protein